MSFFGTISLTASFITGLLCLASFVIKKLRGLRAKAGVLSAVFILTATFSLLYLLIIGDYSVEYVFHNTDKELPLIYKISALWSGSSGSILLWAVCNSVFFLAINAIFGRRSDNFVNCTAIVITVLNLGFLIVLLFINNPFTKTISNSDGFGLSPSLQSLGMVFHPPLIMISYSCLFTAFAARLSRIIKPEEKNKKAAVCFALLGWILLTVGIVSGGIWAYVELGWGGYWSWDPIETTALITWLLLTAYIHLMYVYKADCSGNKTLFLYMSAVVFSILFGTFTARSGVLKSIHSYSSQASKLFFLILLGALIVLCVFMYIMIFKKRLNADKQNFKLRNTYKYLPVIILTVCALVLLFMTLAPIMPIDSAGISEYTYDFFFSLFGLVLLLLSSYYYSIRNITGSKKIVTTALSLAAGICIFFLRAFAQYSVLTRTILSVCCLCLTAMIISFVFLSTAVIKSKKYLAEYLIHLALIIIAFGLVGSRGMKAEAIEVIGTNDTLMLENHKLTMTALSVDDNNDVITWNVGMNYHVNDNNDINVDKSITVYLQYYKMKDIYHSRAYIHSSVGEDFFIIAENAEDDGKMLIKAVVFKWVSFLWLGICVMLLASVYLYIKALHGSSKIT
jgi:cytochrome c-type biogenesis protein CcmF